jgi:hypothetical protein
MYIEQNYWLPFLTLPAGATLLRILFPAMEWHLAAVLGFTHQDESEGSGSFVLNS